MGEDYEIPVHQESDGDYLAAGNPHVKLELFQPHEDTSGLRAIAEAAFGSGPDAELDEWFSFEEMSQAIQKGRGACVKALDDTGQVQGFTYAQPENPINGREGLAKWVIVLAAVKPEVAGRGIGTRLLEGIENQAADNGASKMFVYTNEGDETVINFYRKNGYNAAGHIRDYQYGEDNSAVFLLKHLSMS